MNATLIKMGQRAQEAEQKLMLLDTATKNQALLQMAQALLNNKDKIIAANRIDMENAVAMPKKFTDRLLINESRIDDMANGLKTVAQLPDPIARIDKGWYTAD
ncbi:gamma-glutamyl-phosphate reductase, partial [Limosilactobacillus mucosae]|nr:gamma-glutamyl-phosphate reductase [Limosilactobacillus mucosae]